MKKTPEATGIDNSTLARLTGSKAIANTALRWIPLFLPTLGTAFNASTTQMTTVVGVGEFAGLSTVVSGRHLDRGHERTVMVGAMSVIALSCAIALVGSFTAFAIAFPVLIVGIANFTVAAHTWISHRVDYRWRARSIGLLETSWAMALLVGGPVIALLINWFGWRGPFVVLGVGCAASAIIVATSLPKRGPATADTVDTAASTGHVLTAHAWLTLSGSGLLACAGLSVFVISGTWLDESFGVSTGGLGFIVMGFGAFELIASTGTAAFADRLGKLRSTLAGLIVLGTGLLIMMSAGGALAVGVAGLIVFLLGFEFGFVTSLSLVSEAMPEARGKMLAVANAVGTLARGGGVVLSGWLFSIHGIAGSVSVAASAALLSAGCFLVSRRTN